MPTPITDEAFEFLLARAGLTLTDAEKADLRTVVDGIAAMAERVRKPRGIMAEPALTYGFGQRIYEGRICNGRRSRRSPRRQGGSPRKSCRRSS